MGGYVITLLLSAAVAVSGCTAATSPRPVATGTLLPGQPTVAPARQTAMAEYDPGLLTCPGKHGQIALCYADPRLVGDKDLFEYALEMACDSNLNAAGYCWLQVWDDAKYVPADLTAMTVDEMSHRAALYSRNDLLGYVCFQQVSGGVDVYRSPGCDR